ncbi:hypothetical protein K1F50_06625 [Muricauda oceani]|uniref:Uncharacterized protein n=1 Tax=Flagellimonas oceani TaxID=2698672 RepID=A0A6G7J5S0_9FLAO|nr:hypothetical protein [Allomuricauda oceani]MBW8242470.1 hypothetical protein [Allomuricauda oceani]QII46231.1 hypothetical protein GVT53_16610 [Allomuricauda oceani]
MDTFEKIVNIDLELHTSASDNEKERYDAVLPIISLRLFQKNMGSWGGRETCIGVPEDGYVLVNYWYVLESCAKNAKEQIEQVIQNFDLSAFTRLSVSDALETGEDFKKELEETETLEWCWVRE